MPILFREQKITKPIMKGIRKDAYLNGHKLWVQPNSTETSNKGKSVELFDPSLTVTASSNEPGRGQIQNIIDGNLGTLWQSQGAAPQWIQVTLKSPATATSYRLVCNGNEPVNLPTAWQIHGSSDTQNWSALHSVTGWNPSDKWDQTWEIENKTSFLYYRFYCTDVRTPSYWVYLSEWQLYGYSK
jgi:hypothetical protein